LFTIRLVSFTCRTITVWGHCRGISPFPLFWLGYLVDLVSTLAFILAAGEGPAIT